LAGVLFKEDFSFERACLVPFDVVKGLAAYDEHVNAHILHLEDEVWTAPAVVDISQKVLTALARLDTDLVGIQGS
jgi:hypothetical protein